MPINIGKSMRPLSTAQLHTHPYGQIILNLRGYGTEEVGGQTFPFFPGSLTIVPPETPHGKRSDGVFEDLFFSFDDPLLNECASLRDDEFSSVQKLAETLYGLYYRNEKAATPAVEMLYSALLAVVRELLGRRADDPMTEQIRAALINGFTDPECSVEAILKALGYHPDYARRRFRQKSGVTPQAYLTGLRMEKAAAMLRESAFSVSEIALSCGYYDASYFSRVFRSQYGVTPREYAAGKTHS